MGREICALRQDGEMVIGQNRHFSGLLSPGIMQGARRAELSFTKKSGAESGILQLQLVAESVPSTGSCTYAKCE